MKHTRDGAFVYGHFERSSARWQPNPDPDLRQSPSGCLPKMPGQVKASFDLFCSCLARSSESPPRDVAAVSAISRLQLAFCCCRTEFCTFLGATRILECSHPRPPTRTGESVWRPASDETGISLPFSAWISWEEEDALPSPREEIRTTCVEVTCSILQLDLCESVEDDGLNN